MNVSDVFTRHWVCNVARSGYHNGAGCSPSDPHDLSQWHCGYRHVASLSDRQWVEFMEAIDATSKQELAQVGDLIGPNATDIPEDVLEVVDNQGTIWRRTTGLERYYVEEDDGSVDLSTEYDWITEGGLSTTPGLIGYAPLQVAKVVQQP